MQVITTHFNADFDCLASMVAAKKLYPKALLVFPGSQERMVREFLKDSDLNYQFERIKRIPLEEVSRLILVDTRMAERIGDFASLIGKPGVEVHIYDHHPQQVGDIEGHLAVIRERGSTTTIFVEIFRERGIPITPTEATVMALGIYEDTGGLTFSSTTPEDLEAAAFLITCGADLNTVSDFLEREMTAEQVNLLDDLLQNAEPRLVNGVEVTLATASREEYIGDVALLVHKLKDIMNLNVCFALVQMEGRVHLVARSRIEAVDCASVADAFGGGGHPTAASATIRNMTMVEAKERLLHVLQENIHIVKEAREVMQSPLKTIPITAALKEAVEVMVRFSLNTIPVVDGPRPVGLISRHVAEKALYHGIGEESVSEFMSTEFETVLPDAPYHVLEELIVSRKQKLVPIVDPATGSLLGGVSRSDFLGLLHEDLLKRSPLLEGTEGQGRRYPSKKNVKGLVEERVPPDIIGLLQAAGKAAEAEGMLAFVVGGFVRDLLLRIENCDIDIVVEGDGIKVAHRLASMLGARVSPHEQFGTAVLVLPDGFRMDVATARVEYYEYPAAPPVVEQSSLRHDLFRRDFTINALAIRLNGRDAFRLVDFFGGQRDLKERTIRVLHNLSFVEDPARVIRAIRFEQRFDFTIGRQTAALLKNAVARDCFGQLSPVRLGTELGYILSEKQPLKMVRRMAELDVLRFIHPGISWGVESRQLLQRLQEAVAWYGLLYLDLPPLEKWFCYLMALLDPLTVEEARKVGGRLALPERLQTVIEKLWEERSGLSILLHRRPPPKPSEIFGALRGVAPEALLVLMARAESEEALRWISHYLTTSRAIVTEIGGEDLIALGMEPGPRFKEILEEVRNRRIDGELKTKEEELAFVRDNYVPMVR
jgi:tRNA nucleotidyltransferase (CCA-adding enzyme)